MLFFIYFFNAAIGGWEEMLDYHLGPPTLQGKIIGATSSSFFLISHLKFSRFFRDVNYYFSFSLVPPCVFGRVSKLKRQVLMATFGTNTLKL